MPRDKSKNSKKRKSEELLSKSSLIVWQAASFYCELLQACWWLKILINIWDWRLCLFSVKAAKFVRKNSQTPETVLSTESPHPALHGILQEPYLSSIFFRLWKIHQFHPLTTSETNFCQGYLIRSAFYFAKLHCLKKTTHLRAQWQLMHFSISALCFVFYFSYFYSYLLKER